MRKKIWLISLLILFVTGLLIFINPNQMFTKLILRITGHYETPQYETRSSVLSVVIHKNLYYDRFYRLKNYTAFSDFQRRKMIQIPFVQIYNREKNMLSLASGSECKWALMDFFNQRDSSKLIADDTTMYENVMKQLEPIEIKSNLDTFEYYIIAGWAKYAPRLSDSLFIETNKIKKSLNDKICISYINFDIQKDWESEMDSLQHLSKKNMN